VQFNDITDLGGWEGYSVTEIHKSDDDCHLTLTAYRNQTGICPQCQRQGLPLHDYRWRRIHELPVFGIPVILHVERRRFRCPECGVVTERLPWLEPRHRVTKRMERAIGELCEHMTIKHTARFFRLDWGTVKAVDKRHLKENLATQEEVPIRIIGMDEFAIQKGHRYATVIINLETGAVIWVGRGRSRDAVRPFFKQLGSIACEGIKAVALDCSAAYGNEIKDHCPNAHIVYDLFHFVARYGREVIDRVRVDEANRLRDDPRERKVVKGTRWLLLKNPSNIQNPKDKIRLQDLLSANKSLAKVYILKEDFKRLWLCRDRGIAETEYASWYRRAVRSRISPLVKFAKNLYLWKDGILAHAEYPIHTSVIEGVNNKIKVIKRMGYGFRDDEYFFLKIRSAFYHPKTG